MRLNTAASLILLTSSLSTAGALIAPSATKRLAFQSNGLKSAVTTFTCRPSPPTRLYAESDEEDDNNKEELFNPYADPNYPEVSCLGFSCAAISTFVCGQLQFFLIGFVLPMFKMPRHRIQCPNALSNS